MKLFDSNIEILAVRTLLQSSRGGLPLLAKMRLEHFGHDPAKEIIARIQVMVNNGKGVPNIELLKQDQSVSENARVMLSSQIEVLEQEHDIESCLDSLEGYRHTRIVYETIKKSAELMQGASPDIKKALEVMSDGVTNCVSNSGKSEMEHIMDTDPDAYLKLVDESLEGELDDFLPSGFKHFDKDYGGFSRGNVLLLAAPSGKGKSAMMLRMAMLQYMMGLNVLVISFEMTNPELRERLLSSVSLMDHQDIRLKRLIKEQKDLIKKKMKDFVKTGAGNKLTLWGTSDDMSVPEIGAIVSHMGYDVVYIDYIGLVKAPQGKEQHQVLGDIVRDCKLMGKKNKQLVVPMAQLDDETLKIKYSKAIKANCDFIWAWELNKMEQEMGILKIDQLKVRHGPEKPFYLRIDLSKMQFTDYDGPEPQFAPKEEKRPMPKMNIGSGS